LIYIVICAFIIVCPLSCIVHIEVCISYIRCRCYNIIYGLFLSKSFIGDYWSFKNLSAFFRLQKVKKEIWCLEVFELRLRRSCKCMHFETIIICSILRKMGVVWCSSIEFITAANVVYSTTAPKATSPIYIYL